MGGAALSKEGGDGDFANDTAAIVFVCEEPDTFDGFREIRCAVTAGTKASRLGRKASDFVSPEPTLTRLSKLDSLVLILERELFLSDVEPTDLSSDGK
jgi:hypothetical protein